MVTAETGDSYRSHVVRIGIGNQLHGIGPGQESDIPAGSHASRQRLEEVRLRARGQHLADNPATVECERCCRLIRPVRRIEVEAASRAHRLGARVEGAQSRVVNRPAAMRDPIAGVQIRRVERCQVQVRAAVQHHVPLRRGAANSTVMRIDRIRIEIVVLGHLAVRQRLSLRVRLEVPGFDQTHLQVLPEKLLRSRQTCRSGTDDADIALYPRILADCSSINEHGMILSRFFSLPSNAVCSRRQDAGICRRTLLGAYGELQGGWPWYWSSCSARLSDHPRKDCTRFTSRSKILFSSFRVSI